MNLILLLCSKETSFNTLINLVLENKNNGQVARLIKSIGHVGKTDDFTIKPTEQNSFLVAGLSTEEV